MSTDTAAPAPELARVLMYASRSGWIALLPGPKSNPGMHLYWVEEIDTHPSFGRGFLIRPVFQRQEPYQTCIGEQPSCTCKAFLYSDGCKHIKHLRQLESDGSLDFNLA